MAYEHILVERSGDVVGIVVGRPERAAATAAMFREIASALGDLGGARAVLMTGPEEGCSSRSNVVGESGQLSTAEHVSAELAECYEIALNVLANLSIPVVSAVFGRAAGMWCCLALNADFCVASDDAYFRQAFVNLDSSPDANAFDTLSRLVGGARANEMMKRGERMSAAAAFEAGMIYKVVALEALHQEAFALAARLAAGPTIAYAAIRRQIRAAFESDLATTMEREADDQRDMLRTADAREGALAALQLRKPLFEGR